MSWLYSGCYNQQDTYQDPFAIVQAACHSLNGSNKDCGRK